MVANNKIADFKMLQILCSPESAADAVRSG